MAAAAQDAVSNRGERIEYDADGYAYHHYHVDANGDDLFRCYGIRGCKGKAKFMHGRFVNYQDQAFHFPKDHDKQLRLMKQKDRHAGASTERVVLTLKSTYIGVKDAHGIRVRPMHRVDTWSIYDRIILHSQIGNSTIEAFNRKLQSVPPHSTAPKVASILAEHDRIFENKHNFAKNAPASLPPETPICKQTAWTF